MKFFTVDEAEALIPQLEEIFRVVADLAAQAEAKAHRLKSRRQEDPAQSAIDRSQVEFLAKEIESRLQQIVDLGAVPKGLEPALVDFPAHLEGHDVFLCWKLGEKAITAFHGAEDGFSGRRPLPKRRLP